jgi:hypothetical protein
VVESQLAYTSLTVDASTYQVLDVTTEGGFAIQASNIPGISTGGEIQVSNLNFHLNTGEVYGTVAGVKADGTHVDAVDVKLFDILPGVAVGLSVTPEHWLVFDGSFGTLQMTVGASDLLTQSLGLSSDPPGSVLPSVFAAFATGNLHVQMSGYFGGPVTDLPEPASYAMTSLGLLMVGVAARGRRQTAQPTQG